MTVFVEYLGALYVMKTLLDILVLRGISAKIQHIQSFKLHRDAVSMSYNTL